MLKLLRSETGRILVESHRGSECGAPPNSWPSLELALEGGADMIEVDVQASRDGVAFLRHPYGFDDGRLARDYDWAELARLRFEGEPLPRLDEVLAWAESHDALLTLDLKDGFGDEGLVVAAAEAAVAEADAFERVIAFGWNHAALRGWKERHPESTTRAGLRGRLVDMAGAIEAAHADAVGLSFDLTRREDVDALHERGIVVGVGGMWEPDFAAVVALGVDVVSWGDPAEARRALDALG